MGKTYIDIAQEAHAEKLTQMNEAIQAKRFLTDTFLTNVLIPGHVAETVSTLSNLIGRYQIELEGLAEEARTALLWGEEVENAAGQ